MSSDGIERMIDGALAGYVQEPRPGLEERVLESVRQAKPGRARILGWALAGAAVLFLVAAGIVFRPGRSPAPVERAHVPAAPPPALAASAPLPEAPAPRAPAPRPVRHARTLPKRSQFPTSLPLTPEERAVIGIAMRDPELLVNSSRSAGPLDILDLEIQPLEIN